MCVYVMCMRLKIFLELFIQRVNMDILYVVSVCMDMAPPPPNSQSFHQAE